MSSDNHVAQRFREQHKSARILVHPDGRSLSTWQKNYHGSSIKRVNMGMLSPRDSHAVANDDEVRRPSSASLRQLFGCGRRSFLSAAVNMDHRSHSSTFSSENDDEDDDDQAEHRDFFLHSCFHGRPRALLCLESGRELSRECLILSCLPKPSFADMACRVGDMSATCLWSCCRHKKMLCRPWGRNDTTFEDMSRHVFKCLQ
jgi:hypothetical protein